MPTPLHGVLMGIPCRESASLFRLSVLNNNDTKRVAVIDLSKLSLFLVKYILLSRIPTHPKT